MTLSYSHIHYHMKCINEQICSRQIHSLYKIAKVVRIGIKIVVSVSVFVQLNIEQKVIIFNICLYILCFIHVSYISYVPYACGNYFIHKCGMLKWQRPLPIKRDFRQNMLVWRRSLDIVFVFQMPLVNVLSTNFLCICEHSNIYGNECDWRH